MSGLFGILSTSRNALAVTQNGIATTGHNISNVNTPGYTRQRQELAAEFASTSPAGAIGNGVRQLGVERVTDVFVERQLLHEHSSFSATDAQAQTLTQLELILNEQDAPGVVSALTEFYDTLSELETVPDGPVEREAVRSAGLSVIDALHRADGQLRQQQLDLQDTIGSTLTQINGMLARIADLNGDIRRAEALASANDLRDQRDQLVRDLSDRLDFNVIERPDGSLQLSTLFGAPLVQTDRPATLSVQGDPANPFGANLGRIILVQGSAQFDVTDQIGAGSLGGHLRARDTIIPAAIRSLDTVAYNLSQTLNSVHSAGTGLDGLNGRNFFTAFAQVEDAARNIGLDAAVAASTDAIAAGLGSTLGDGRNAAAMAALRNASGPLFLPGDPPGPASGPARSVLDHMAFVISDVGQQASDLNRAREQDRLVLATLQDRRDEISGVSLDEEMTNLIQLQATFQANARVITVVDRLLDSLVNIL